MKFGHKYLWNLLKILRSRQINSIHIYAELSDVNSHLSLHQFPSTPNVYKHALSLIYANTHFLSCIQIRTFLYKYTLFLIQTHTLSHIQTRTHSYTNTHTISHTNTHTHFLIQTYTLIYKYTHTFSYKLALSHKSPDWKIPLISSKIPVTGQYLSRVQYPGIHISSKMPATGNTAKPTIPKTTLHSEDVKKGLVDQD